MTDDFVVIFIRGDLDVNETKLTNYLGEEVHPAVITSDCGLNAGYIGPVNLTVNGNYTVLYDKSLQGTNNLSCGANEEEYHYTGLCMERDVVDAEYVDLAKIVDGGICPHCGKKTIHISRGIEVGNIFQLGTKYTKSMNMQYLDADGESHYPIMGCYGIGVGRLAASVCEAHHDDYGPVWPITIAPWQVHLCCLRADDAEAKAFADELYASLQKEHIEVIYDDRNVRPGVMFSDADLLGVPIRLVVSPRNMKESVVELSSRDKSVQDKVALADVVPAVKKLNQNNQKMKPVCEKANRLFFIINSFTLHESVLQNTPLLLPLSFQKELLIHQTNYPLPYADNAHHLLLLFFLFVIWPDFSDKTS